jgi:hypothetical protein
MHVVAEAFILYYLEKHSFGGGVDILDSDFVDAFAIATQCKVKATCFGAFKCDYLGRTLSRMYKDKQLKRGRIGLSGGSWYPGFPKWVYVYWLKE